ncbi:hypothetical protein K1719_025180 [Acacia pycnantha]|nr:hypothetical protein K1719_025180 [Acacia pycnantha]
MFSSSQHDGRRIHDLRYQPEQVTSVGMVFEKVDQNTDVSFVADDGTGLIKCQRWVNEPFATKEMEEIR